jgi:hypothetical protein
VNVSLSLPPAQLHISFPAEGSTVSGPNVVVTYASSGDSTGVDHVHFQLDADPEVRDMDFDGEYEFTNVPIGPHVLRGYLARADHSQIPGTEVIVNFVVGQAPPVITPPPPPSNTGRSGRGNKNRLVSKTHNAFFEGASSVAIYSRRGGDALKIIHGSNDGVTIRLTDVSDLAAGLYIAKVKSTDGSGETTEKLMIVR